ncbi:MAG TPA: hypothetical protein VFE62_04300 [Gemmataceae bacterium]|nr:hypothetical protein [Gemmataceae bacterium]
MNKDLLCTWLGLPKADWPPDAWSLLGLPRGDHDLPTIEKNVQARMAKLRSYQLSFPEEATEGMNRLAEAFVTVTDACAKPAPAAPPPPVAEKPALDRSKDDTVIGDKTSMDWRSAPPPVRNGAATAPNTLAVANTPQVIVDDEAKHVEVLTSKPFIPPAKPPCREIDVRFIHELAEESDDATSNLGTLEAVIERVEETRRLLHVWDQVGKQIRCSTKKPSPKECEIFAARLEKIAKVMQTYPAFLGHPGLPGYRLVVQARLRIPLSNLRALPKEQRDDLIFDWQSARQVLLTHRKYLHRVFKSLRHRTVVGLVLHFIRATLNDHPLLTLGGVALLIALIVSIVIAIYR